MRMPRHLVLLAGLVASLSTVSNATAAGLLKSPAVPAASRPAEHRLLPLTDSARFVAASPRTVCEGRWQEASNTAFLDWITGLEAYHTYQDPTETGCANTYPFGVVSIIWPLYVRVPGKVKVYPAILRDSIMFNEADSVNCDYPGDVVLIGPDTTITLADTGFYQLEIFLPDTCCVNGPYFATIVIDTFLNTGKIDIVVDSAGSPRQCASYNDWGHGPSDLVSISGFTHNLKLWSRGVNATQNHCYCCTGTRGNVDCDIDGNIDIADLTRLIDNLYISFGPLCCEPAANCDGQEGVDIADMTALIDRLYLTFAPLPACP
jgi:hypothetical protein